MDRNPGRWLRCYGTKLDDAEQEKKGERREEKRREGERLGWSLLSYKGLREGGGRREREATTTDSIEKEILLVLQISTIQQQISVLAFALQLFS